ncbi:Uncharacterised protein [Algoriella xinjiangensis]|nr:Uncharacterised protein [Algoriella xinjiangensis]
MSEKKENLMFWYLLLTSFATTITGFVAMCYFIYWLYLKLS